MRPVPWGMGEDGELGTGIGTDEDEVSLDLRAPSSRGVDKELESGIGVGPSEPVLGSSNPIPSEVDPASIQFKQLYSLV